MIRICSLRAAALHNIERGNKWLLRGFKIMPKSMLPDYCLTRLILVVFVLSLFPPCLSAENPYDWRQPEPDPKIFPHQSDKKMSDQGKKSLDRLDDARKRIGERDQKDFGPGGKWMKDETTYKDHPWKEGNPNSEKDYTDDSKTILSKSHESPQWRKCFDMKKVEDPMLNMICKQTCLAPPWCPYDPWWVVIEYWWAENQMETNNFAISSLDPKKKGRKDLARDKLIEEKKKRQKDYVLEVQKELYQKYTGQQLDQSAEKLQDGYSNWTSFNVQNDAFVEMTEGHTYRSALSVRTSNRRPRSDLGYMWDSPVMDRCLYDSLPPPTSEKELINLWTEQPIAHSVWRYAAMSEKIDKKKTEKVVILPKLIGDAVDEEYQKGEKKSLACAQWRAGKQSLNKDPSIDYNDLKDSPYLKLKPLSDETLDKICWIGGGQLYPLMGAGMYGSYTPLPHSAFIARRCIELSSTKSEYMKRPLKKEKRRANLYTLKKGEVTKDIDKMERIFPKKELPSECFRMNDVPRYDPLNKNFPSDLVEPDHLGSIRHAYWNKRITCACVCLNIAGGTGCWNMNDGDKEEDDELGKMSLIPGWAHLKAELIIPHKRLRDDASQRAPGEPGG